MTQQQTETGKTTAEFIESLGCPVEASVETTCGPLKLVKSPEEELFGRPVEVAVDHRLEIARELERVTGYRWGRWQSSSGETKLHLTGSTKPETPTFVTACGNVVFRPYCESLTLTYDGNRCKRCMAIDGVAFAADLARREAEHAISDAAWWRRTRPRRQQARVVTGRGLSISFQNIEGETIRLEPRPFERDPHSREVAIRGTFAPYAPLPDINAIAITFGVSPSLLEGEGRARFSTQATVELEREVREQHVRFRHDVDIVMESTDAPYYGGYERQLTRQARAAARLLGVDEIDQNHRTDLIYRARERIAAYGVSYRAPDAWCMGSRWRPLTGYGGGRSMPTRAQIEALPARFRDVCGE